MLQLVGVQRHNRKAEGEAVSARDYNKILDDLEGLSIVVHDLMNIVRTGRMQLGELAEDVEANDRDKDANVLFFDSATTAGNDPWGDIGRDIERIADPQEGLWLQGERHLFWWLSHAHRFVMLPGVQLHIAKLDGDLSQGSTATASVWEEDTASPGTFVDSGKDITVYDWLLASGQSITAGKKIIVAQHLQSRLFIVIAAECA